MAKAKNPRGMPSSEVLETATRSIARPGTYLFRYSLGHEPQIDPWCALSSALIRRVEVPPVLG
jgi:hypothetical protein